jgi:hypothetical protein
MWPRAGSLGFTVSGLQSCRVISLPLSMPKTPKGAKRPADVISNAVHVMRIATGEVEETIQPETGKNAAAVELGRSGGRARAVALSAKKKRQIALSAANARWGRSRHRGRTK